jgi:arsenate reductase
VLLSSTTARSLLAEALGTALLVAVVVGSGIMAQRLTDDVGVQLLANLMATGAALIALILAFGPVSGAHFNPVVTLADRLLGGIATTTALLYAVAQVVGGCVGCVAANVMFSLPAVDVSTHARSGGGLWLAEAIATFGLVLVILGTVRSANARYVPFAVGAYIAAGYWFTSSTSFANPAVTVARTLSNTFAGIAPASVPGFVVAQVVGGLAAIAVALCLFPDVPADAVVVPHEADPAREG